MGLFSKAGARIDTITQRLQAAATAFWQPTNETYSPSRNAWPVAGQIYGASANSLEAVRQCEELAIGLTRLGQAIAAMDWDICEVGVNGAVKPIRQGKSHAAAQLFLQPNPLCDWSDFVQSCVFMYPTGSINILMDMSVLKTPFRIWLLRSDKTRPIRSVDPMKILDGYEHYAEDGLRYVFPVDQMIHLKSPNPFTPYQGLGITELIDMTLNMDMATLNYNWRFFLQGGNLENVLTSDKDITPKRRQEIIDGFNERYAGFQNAHRLMILDGGLKKDNNTKTPVEVGFKDTREGISRTVGGILGVTPIHMGHVENSNRATAAVQEGIFFSDGVLPLARRINDALTRIVQRFDKNLVFRLRTNTIIDTELATAQMTAATACGAMSPNEARVKYLNLEAIPNPEMDKHYIPLNMVAIEDMPEAKASAAAPEVKPGADPKPGKEGVTRLPSADEAKAVELAIRRLQDDGKAPKGTPAQRRVLRFLVQKRVRPEKRMKAAYSRWLRNFGEAAAASIEAQHVYNSVMPPVHVMINTLHLVSRKAVDDLPSVTQAVFPIYKDELSQQYQELADLFSIEATFEQDAQSTSLARLGQRVSGIEERAREELDALIKDGAQQGLTPTEIANGTADGSFEGIRGKFADMAPERAQLIARTETGALQDQASLNAYKNMGVNSVDVIGCEDFEIMDGEQYGCNSQNIPISTAFSVEFHPNHRGAIVPRIEKALQLAALMRPMFHVER